MKNLIYKLDELTLTVLFYIHDDFYSYVIYSQ